MSWDTNHDGLRQVFCAALSGIIANPAFFGSIFQQSPNAAVDFANEVVEAALKSNGGERKGSGACQDPIGCTEPCHCDDGVLYCDVCGMFEGCRRPGNTPSMKRAAEKAAGGDDDPTLHHATGAP